MILEVTEAHDHDNSTHLEIFTIFSLESHARLQKTLKIHQIYLKSVSLYQVRSL